MKVPFTANQTTHQSSSKPTVAAIHGNINTAGVSNSIFQVSNINTSNLCYEPKSVLELRRSPSPAVDKPVVTTGFPVVSDIVLPPSSDDPIQLENHVLNLSEDWDSLMREWGLHEDSSTSTSKLHQQQTQGDSHFPVPELGTNSFEPIQFVPSDFSLSDPPPYPVLNIKSENNSLDLELSDDHFSHENHCNTGFDFVDDLIRVTEYIETNSLQLAHAILARLNLQLQSSTCKPLQRASFYFKEALQFLLSGSTRQARPSTTLEVIDTIKAYKAFSNFSPIPMFTSFTANQAILEAVDGSILVHVIDFDIGLGGHWASFMKELFESRKSYLPVLRITAVVDEEYSVESRLIRENLTQFANELKLGFDIQFVSIRNFEYLSFKSVKFLEGEKTVVLLSPSIFRRIGVGFLNDIRGILPHVVVYVDAEGLTGNGPTTFRQRLIDGLDFYSTVLQSLEAAKVGDGGDDWIKKIERFVLFPRILEAMEQGGRGSGTTSWKEAFVGAGLRPVGLSHFAKFQADYLLRRVQVKGFHVAKHQSELVLCWHDRTLVATSAWRC